MKTLKPIFALGLAAAFFVGCSKSDTNTNSANTGNSNSKVSSSSTTTTTTANATPATTTNSSASSSSSAAAAAGEVFTHQEGGIQFTAPANWTSKNEAETMTLFAPHNALSVVFWVPKGEDFSKAVEDLDAQLESVIKNPKVTSPGEEVTHNGMKAYTSAGTGEVDGEQIVWEVDILQAKKPVFVVSFAAPAMFAQHEGEYKQLLSSIKRVN